MFKRVILYLTLIVTVVLILFAVLNRPNTHSLIPLFGVSNGEVVSQTEEPVEEEAGEQTVELPAELTEDPQEPAVAQ